MKTHIDPKHRSIGLTAFLVILASMLVLFLLWRFEVVEQVFGFLVSAFTPVLIGLVIAYIMLPIMRFFERRYYSAVSKKAESPVKAKKITRALSIATAMVIVWAIIVGLLWLLLPQLIESISSLVAALPGYFTNLRDTVVSLLSNRPQLQEQAASFFNDFQSTLTGLLTDTVLPQMGGWVSSLTSGIMGFFGMMLNVIVGFILAIYVLYNKDLYCAQCKKLLYALFKPERANGILRVTRLTHKSFGGFLTGQIVNAAIVGVLCFLCMTIFQMPYALLVSVVVGVFNIIPFFGPFIGAIPCAVLILMVDPWACLWFILLICILQQVDGNIISPKILGESVGLSGFWIMVSILVMGNLLGFVGMIIGVPLFAVLYTLAREKITRRLKQKRLDLDAGEYSTLEYLEQDEDGQASVTHLTADEFAPRPKKEAPSEKKKPDLLKIFRKKR